LRINQSFPKKNSLRPYLVIALAAILAYLPVSSMLFSLKNDVLAIEYPIRFFLSESIRNGESPLWFNTWCLGFPMQSVLTWGTFSTTAMVTGLFPSDLYVLHISFVMFVMLSGWSMYKLLKTHFIPAKDLSLLLSCCYMLSGFTVSSSQWLLYLTGMAFIPFLLHCSMNLVKRPGLRNAFLWGLSYFLLLTNVHVYLTVFASYFLVFFFVITLMRVFLDKTKINRDKKQLLLFTGLGALFAAILCAAPVYYTIETVSYLERSSPLTDDSSFFRSNYFHPEGFKSLLFPLSTIKTIHFNTEGSIQNIYLGLLPLLLLPVSLLINFRTTNKRAWFLLALSIFFLLLSFGYLLPFREWLNILPGLSYFRHPGILRIFFTMAIIIYLGHSLRNYNLGDLLKAGSREKKLIQSTLFVLGLIALVVLLLHVRSVTGIYQGSIAASIRSINDSQLLFINSLIQLVFCLLLLLSIPKKKNLFSFLLITELVLNFLCCTAFYAVSSTPVKTVNNLLEIRRGFPVQNSIPYSVPAELNGEGETVWRNTNVFKKEVSVNVSMPGPLILEKVHLFLMSAKESLKDKAFAFINDSSSSPGSITVLEQRPAMVKLKLQLSRVSEIIVQQAYFPGWKAYYNDKEVPLSQSGYPFISAIAPVGEGELKFRFEKNGVTFSAILLHLVVLISFLLLAFRKLSIRPVSLS
jgi:hypothetical protein